MRAQTGPNQRHQNSVNLPRGRHLFLPDRLECIRKDQIDDHGPMEEHRVIQSIVLIQDSNYVQQGDRLRVQSTLRKNGPDSSLLWLINVWSGCRGGGFLRIGQLCSEFRCERRGRTVGNSGIF